MYFFTSDTHFGHKKDNMFNVGVDVNDYTPVHEDVIISWLRGKGFYGRFKPYTKYTEKTEN